MQPLSALLLDLLSMLPHEQAEVSPRQFVVHLPSRQAANQPFLADLERSLLPSIRQAANSKSVLPNIDGVSRGELHPL